VLGADAAERFLRVYDLTLIARLPNSTLEQPGVLRMRTEFRQKSGDDVAGALNSLAPLRAKLLAARNRRPQPLRDDKIVVGINGLAIDAFVWSARVLRRERDLEVAKRTGERLWTLAYEPKTGRLRHEIFRQRAQTDGYLDDYALLGRSFLSLYEATTDQLWRARAGALADAIGRHFFREDGRLSTSPNETALLIAPQDHGDDVQSSGTSAAIDLLLRLGRAPGGARYTSVADRTLRYIARSVSEHGDSWGTLVAAVNLHGPGNVWARAGRAWSGAGVDVFSSAARVRVTASTATKDDHDEIVTTIQVEEGWHVNANPASFDYLIPTSVSFEGLPAIRVVYPQAVRIKPQFAPDGLDVYEGVTRIVAVFPKGSLKDADCLRGALTVQACSNEVCLPPAKLRVAPE
jgi:uncharacterized protein YyaL (SSP411 family)